MITDIAERLQKLPLWMQLIFVEDLFATADQRLDVFEKIAAKKGKA